MCDNCEIISSALTSLYAESLDIASTSVIDPEGDVVLVCGGTESQVSSKVLILASPVFKALFSSSFAEGQPTPSKVVRVQLFDDDAESMRFMCAVIHHKSACANGIGLEKFERLGVLTDKYDVCMFSRNIRLTGMFILSLYLNWEPISYLFDRHDIAKRQDEHMLTRLAQ